MSLRYAVVFLLLAATLALAALLTPFLVVQLLWLNAAVAFAALAVAYAGAGPGLLGKRPDGRRRLWAWPIFWPYFVLNALSFRLYRSLIREPAFAEVVPNLHFGRRLTTGEVRRAAIVWQAVLDLACEFPEAAPLRRVAAYRSLPVLDATAPSPAGLQAAVAWLTAAFQAGPVYVHCALGHGRSATVVLALLLTTGQVGTVKEGLALLRAKRPGVGLNRAQRALLKRMETAQPN
jgi:protein-tyrosine phosphatase